MESTVLCNGLSHLWLAGWNMDFTPWLWNSPKLDSPRAVQVSKDMKVILRPCYMIFHEMASDMKDFVIGKFPSVACILARV
jgi:hypothetical protein